MSNVEWSITELDGNMVVYTDYTNFISHMDNQANIVRYLEQLKSTVCVYRKNLNEPFCEQQRVSVNE